MKVLFVITSSDLAVWLSEVTHPYWHLSERGVEVDFASPKGGKVTVYPESNPYAKNSQESDDLVSKGFLSDKNLVAKLDATFPLAEVDLTTYDGVHVAGGVDAGVDLYPSEEVKAVLRYFWSAGKTVGAICHGAIALGNIPEHIGGRRVTGYSLDEDRILEKSMGKASIPNLPQPILEEAGGIYSSVKPFGVRVIVDGQLVTGQNQQSASEYALVFYHVLAGDSPVLVA